MSDEKKIRELSDEVIQCWKDKVRTKVKPASLLTEPILVNSLPVLYAGIADAFETNTPDGYAGLTASVGLEHGNERARVTSYDLASVIAEYQLFREAVEDVLAANNISLSRADSRILNTIVDMAISHAATGFSLVQAAFRERFIASLAHDLRNPLNAANVATQLIFRTSDMAQIQRLGVRIETSIGRVGRMIEELLDTVVFEAGERIKLNLHEFDLMTLVSEVVEYSRDLYAQRFEISGSSSIGWWSYDNLRRALENLIGNAGKYGDRNSVITINVKSYHGRTVLSVHNVGTAIPPEELESIFKVFERAKQEKNNSTQGWGLGLPFVRCVSESHGGSIGAESSHEKGTTFTIDMPTDARPFINFPVLGA
jgi:signal transduction histidine kinase